MDLGPDQVRPEPDHNYPHRWIWDPRPPSKPDLAPRSLNRTESVHPHGRHELADPDIAFPIFRFRAWRNGHSRDITPRGNK